MQRLLLEGMKLVHDGVRSTTPEAEALADTDQAFPFEAYGHLAAALRPQMVEATDERLETLASKHFFPMIAHAVELGACRPVVGCSHHIRPSLCVRRCHVH